NQPVDGRNVDEDPCPTFDHLGQERLSAEENRLEVHIQGFVPLRLSQSEHSDVMNSDGGAIDNDVNTTQPIPSRLKLCPRLTILDVTANHFNRGTKLLSVGSGEIKSLCLAATD